MSKLIDHSVLSTNVPCGGCGQQLSLEHWKTCPGIQCKCEHYRRHHTKHGHECYKKYCHCRAFEPILNFDTFWGYSKAIEPGVTYDAKGTPHHHRL